jgi:hypothetical protein
LALLTSRTLAQPVPFITIEPIVTGYTPSFTSIGNTHHQNEVTAAVGDIIALWPQFEADEKL